MTLEVLPAMLSLRKFRHHERDVLSLFFPYDRALINQVKVLEPKRKKAKKAKQSLLKYFMNNLARMNYPYYDTMNYYIGSGTIESAHKFVIHQRMRRSGQRWSRRGANAVMNLRVLRNNNSWNLLFPIMNNAA